MEIEYSRHIVIYELQQDDAGLEGAVPVYGETGGGEVVRADGLGTERTAEAGGVLGEIGDGVASGRCKTTEADASVLV